MFFLFSSDIFITPRIYALTFRNKILVVYFGTLGVARWVAAFTVSVVRPSTFVDLSQIPVDAFNLCGIVVEFQFMIIPSSIGTAFDTARTQFLRSRRSGLGGRLNTPVSDASSSYVPNPANRLGEPFSTSTVNIHWMSYNRPTRQTCGRCVHCDRTMWYSGVSYELLAPPLDDTPPPAPNTQATSDAVTANVHSKPSTTIPATPRLFTFDGPSGFLTSSIIDYWETIQGGQGWVDMIKTYLQLEQQPIPPGCPLRLPTESRPTELSIWVKGRSLSPDRMPFITDTAAYGEGWIAWWIACQPAWRQGKGWPLPKERGDNVKWGKLGARGQNGMFLVVMSTTWWAASLKPTDDRGTFDGAMDDIRWVILQILEPLPATDAQRATQDPTPPPASQKPVSTAATWQTRTDGKRRSKPSRKLLEALN